MSNSPNKTKLKGTLSGVAGEYYVAARLSQLGYIASITLKNSRGVDILATNEGGTATVSIQVKTNQGSDEHWLLKETAEGVTDRKLFYVFVNLHEGRRPPSFHVVPSKTVATFIRKDHSKWLRTPGRKGQRHRDTTMRTFKISDGTYLDNWNALGL